MTSEDRRQFIRTLPLAELHRHFHGACLTINLTITNN